MLLKNKKVAIVGGGPGGLTLARLLQMNGVEVNVYERDKDQSFRQQGATLDLHAESGLKAIKAARLIEEFKSNYRPGAERFTITDNNAVVHYTERDNAPMEDMDSIFARPEIDRGPLRDLLIDSLNKDVIVWDSKFTELKQNDNGWNLHFENGTVAYADLVVAAEGVNSKLRKYITDLEPVYSGVTIVEGNIYNAAINAPNLWRLTNEGKVYALLNDKTIVLSAKGEGSLSFYTATKEDEDWVKSSGIDFKNKDDVFNWFKKRFADWSDDWHEIFATTDSYFVARPQHCMPVNQPWQTHANITMIGDAAHVTPPSGEGVNQAMLDALELYEALCKQEFDTMQNALTSFENKMQVRTAEVTDEAMQFLHAMHSSGDNLKYMVDFFNGITAMKEA